MQRHNLINRIKLLYFADPVCSTCWIVDPYLKKLLNEYGTIIDLEIKVGGLIDDWDLFQKKRPGVNAEYLYKLWESESKRFQLRMDGSIWKKNPVRSSTPPSIAYYAALQQDANKALAYMRILREKLFLRRKDISEKRHIVTAALQADLDIELFLQALEDGSALQDFERAQKERSKWQVTQFPSMIFVNQNGDFAHGVQPEGDVTLEQMYANWEQIIFDLTEGNPRKIVKTNTVAEVLKKYERLSMFELKVHCGSNERLIAQQIDVLYKEGLLIKEKHGDIVYFRYNNTPFFIMKNGFRFSNTTILGAGVCGRYIAKVLEQSSIQPRVIDRQAKNAFRGLGFIMLRNGIDALDAVGLKNELYKKSNVINFFRAISSDGSPIFHKVLEDCLAISRDGYFELLEETMNRIPVEYEKEGLEIVHDKSNNYGGVRMSDETIDYPEIIFSSDGIRSKMRQQLFPDSELTPLPEREIVGAAYAPDMAFEQDVFLKLVDKENGKYMGILPLGEGHYLWFLQINQNSHPIHNNDPFELEKYTKETTANYPVEFKTMAAMTDFSKAFLWSAHRMDLLPAFHHENLVLLGDAAHPLLAFTSQGANCALEDAAYLLSMLSHQQEDESLEDIFQLYYETRKDAILHHIKEGDTLLEDFLNLRSNKSFKLPLSIH